jgi:hypothetical protein
MTAGLPPKHFAAAIRQPPDEKKQRSWCRVVAIVQRGASPAIACRTGHTSLTAL